MTSLGVYLRGLMMGAADIVPGVSGGTVAFITGIYDTLLASIRAFDLEFVARLWRLQFRSAWGHVNGRFLLALLAGIATSIFSLARLISWLLDNYPVPLWAFFFGLILASAVVLLREVEAWNGARILSLLLGVAAAGAIALSPPASLQLGMVGVFLAGFLAISLPFICSMFFAFHTSICSLSIRAEAIALGCLSSNITMLILPDQSFESRPMVCLKSRSMTGNVFRR